MYALAKSSREKMKAKARALAAPGTLKGGQDTTQADWSPAEPLNADVKTGARPVGKGARLYNKGGKVSGAEAKTRADRKPRKSGGRTVEKEIGVGMANKDVRAANEEREGLKHVGAFKKGGKAKRATGGSVPSKAETQDTKERLGTIKVTPTRGAAGHYKKGGKIAKGDGGETIGSRIVKGLDRLTGYKSPAQKLEEGLSGVGKGRTSSYSSGDKAALSDIAKGGSGSTLPSDEKEFGKSQNYKKGGRTGRATGGGLLGMLKGGKKKASKKAGKTDIHIVINADKTPERRMPRPEATSAAAPPPPPPMPPIGAGAPAASPISAPGLGAAAPDMGLPMGRKAGGRISKVAKSYKDMEAGAGSGEGRLQKTDIESRHTDAPARKAGGRISKVAKSYKDMTAGAGDGEGRLQKTDIAKAKKARGK